MDLTGLTPQLIFSAVCALLAAGGAFAAVRVKLYFHEKWLERHDAEFKAQSAEIRDLRKEHREDVETLHRRIDDIKRAGA